MNKVVMMGRTTRDIELRYASGDEKTAVGRFAIAVARRANKETVDFFNCVAFGKTAENVAKYFHKGDRILISGRMENSSYTNKEGKKVNNPNIVVEEFDFIEPKREESTDEFLDTDTGEDLPFKF